jgi:two-component sensor histidine kinase/putative methionine-R-sulfoxide reductase with GAF domain
MPHHTVRIHNTNKGKTDDTQSPTWFIRIELASDPDTSLELELQDEMWLGATSGPGMVDLRPYQAREYGVSRQHAKIVGTDSALSVVDLGSTNGTSVNGDPLTANVPQTLTSGDVLRLGGLELVIRVIRAPSKPAQAFHQQADLASILEKMAKAITAQLEIEEVLAQALEMAISLTSAREASLWLVDNESRELFLEAERGIEDDAIRRMRLSVDDTMAGKVIRSGKSLRANRSATDDRIKIKTGYVVESLLYVPLTRGDDTFGVLSATHHEPNKTFSPRDEKLLMAIADFTAIAIHNAYLYDRSQREIAERKRAEEMLRATLAEKEVLLREIHHRVKNNLQVISSLLNLEAGQILVEQGVEVLRDSQSRIRAMALVHEHLYRSDNLSSIDFGNYVQILIDQISHSHGALIRQIDIRSDIDNICLPIDAAIPCGLIINELVTNALEHAFPDGRRGTVQIEMKTQPDGSVVLVVSDDGIGVQRDFSLGQADGLGMTLIDTLAKQLEGHVVLDQTEGATFQISFRNGFQSWQVPKSLL